MNYYKQTITGEYTQTFHASFLALHTVLLFLIIKYLTSYCKIMTILEKAVLSAGRCAFGIYLIHILVMRMSWFQNLLNLLCDAGMNYLVSCYLGCFVVFGISWACIYILKKIPFVNELI